MNYGTFRLLCVQIKLKSYHKQLFWLRSINNVNGFTVVFNIDNYYMAINKLAMIQGI